MVKNLTGQVIKGYELNQLIGMGGFAAVYRAYQPAVDREVAIKVVLPRYANAPEFVRRFEAEAQLIARLEHIHIVPLYDYWREPNNAYLVMRWLRGGSLYDSLAAHGAWGVPETARLLDQIAGALLIAHRKGVVHQDLTPANILLDEDSNAFLADFGIAKELLKEADDSDRTLFGSPAYMAPEQILGRGVSPQTDIYSLGIVIYQTLTGRVPFDDPSHTEVMKQQVNAPLPPLQIHRPELPYSLNMVVMQATSKNPLLRYRDTISMATAFRQAMQLSGVVEIVPPPAPLGELASPPLAAQGEGTLDYGEGLVTRDFSGEHMSPSELASESAADAAFKAVPPPAEEPPSTLILEPALATIDFDSLLAPENPYKGLRAFEEADAVDFFGRETLVERLIERLADPSTGRFLAVVGPSGSGKSSVVKAGLLPALHQGRLEGSERWFIAKMVPGTHPFRELATALLSVAVEDTDISEEQLQSSVRGLLRAVLRILSKDESAYLVLVIDQFEEVFTLVEDESVRKHFLGSLLYAIKTLESRLRVIITLRADFYDRPLLYPDFGDLVRQHTEVVLPLAPDELRIAVTGPAERVGLIIEPGLVDAIVTDVSEQPGTLPLLQYALTELFNQRNDRTLTLAAYRANGGVRGALARRAEETFNAMDMGQREMLRQALLRLVSLGEGTEDTRRRVRWSELMALGHGRDRRALMQSVLDTFGQHRLLTFDRDPQTREPTVEVAHEALIREWRRLRAWLDELRDDLRMQRHLSSAVAEWVSADRDSSYLATGARLEQFESLAAHSRLILTEQERDYVRASVALRQRAARRRNLFVMTLIVISVAAVIAALVAMNLQRVARDRQRIAEEERDRADTQARIAQSGALAVNALKNVDQNGIDVALLLSLEAFRAADTFEARNSLLSGVQAAPQLAAYLHGHNAPVRCVAFSPDGALIASGSRDGTILLWDVRTRKPVGPPLNHGSRVYSVAFSPDGSRLVSAGSSGSLRLWDVAGGVAIGDPWEGHEDEVWRAVFSPDGQMVVSASFDGTLRRWNAATGEPIGEPLTGHEDAVYSVAFSPDGTLLASASADFTLRLWEAATGDPVGEPMEGHTNWVLAVAFSPDGRMLASGGADSTVRLWDVTTGEQIGALLSGHSGWVWSVSFSPDGTQLLTSSADFTAALWSLDSGRITNRLTTHTNTVWGATFAPGGRLAVTASEDTTLLLWDLQSAYPLLARLGGHTNPIWGLAVSPADAPGGMFMVSASGENNGGGVDTTVRLWNLPGGTPRAVLSGHTGQVRTVAISPDGQTVASAGADAQIILWDVASETMRFEPLAGHVSHINSVAFSPDGTLLASAGGDGLIRLWDVQTGEPASNPLAGHEGEIYSLAFSPDGRWLASGGFDATARLWNLSVDPPTSVTLAHQDRVMAVAFSPDGRLLATGSHDNTVSLWDVHTQLPVYLALTGHTNYVSSVAFSPDGRMIASGSWDKTIILWDAATGRALGKPLAGHTDTVSAVAFSPDSRLLVSAGWDMALDLWSVSLEDWQAHACQVANRDLTAREWSQYQGEIPYHATCSFQAG